MLVVLGAADVSVAATPAEFHVNLLRRGIVEFDGERYESAASQLRIAAFGLLDAVDHYQVAQVYLALASNRIGDVEAARIAARRVVLAEKIGKTYGSLNLPSGIRSTFDTLAKTLLTPVEVSALAASPKTTPAPAQITTPAKTQSQTSTATAPPAKPATTPQTAQTQTPPKQEAVKQQPAKAEPAKAEPAKAEPAKAEPAKAEPAKAEPAKQDPPKPKPAATTTTTPAPAPPRPAPVTRDVTALFAEAERALNAANLVEARRVYRELLDGQLTHEQALRAGEGLYRARDFAFALRALDKAGALGKGEEPYRYYRAVALYETGKFASAKKELATVLPFIELTPDVARYREKIEGAAD